MDLEVLLLSLTTAEQQQFQQKLKRSNKKKEAPNLKLIQLLLQGHQDAKAISRKLYGKINTHAYHTLRQRVYESLVLFVAEQRSKQELTQESTLRQYILTARHLFAQKHVKPALKLLSKAERKAQNLQQLIILNDIYHTQIEYSHLFDQSTQQNIFDRFTQNQKLLIQEDKLNMAYAYIKLQFKQVNFEGKAQPFGQLVSSTFKRFDIDIKTNLNFKSLFQLIEIHNIQASLHRDFASIEPFILQQYDLVSQREQSPDRYLIYHLHLLYLIANIYFRKKDFLTCFSFLAKLQAHMLHQKKRYYNAFFYKYHNLQGLALNYSGQQEAALQHMSPHHKLKTDGSPGHIDSVICHVVILFLSQQFKPAKQLFSKFIHTTKWYIQKMGVEWTMKQHLIEILLYLELEDFDFAESKIQGFFKKFGTYLTEAEEQHILTFVKFLGQYARNPKQVEELKFKKLIESSFTWKDPMQEDIFIQSFYAWLKAKMEKRDVYETTLELIQMR